MKKLLILVCCILPTIAFAQEQNSIQQKVETTIGKLIVENLALSAKIETLNKEIVDLKKRLEEKDKK